MAQPTEQKEDVKCFVRVVNTDLPGNKHISYALTKIKGVNYQFAHAICTVLKMDPTTKAGTLDDPALKRIEEVLKNPIKFGVPTWMLNRRMDYETGADMHIIGTDVDIIEDDDIKRMKKMRSYKGVRHMRGLTVRGQRTKSNFRKNKGKTSLGVKRKASAKSGRV